MMTAVSMFQHAAGVTPKMRGGGLFSFIKYENRAISVVSSGALTVGLAALALS
jgi:hypothetical protein